jgi:hypothetical protein
MNKAYTRVEISRSHANNNDEADSLDRRWIGSFSKSLGHDDLGDPDPVSYGTLLRALQSGDREDFEEIRLGSANAVRLIHPQAGAAFERVPQELALPPAPRFDSERTAHEMGELYWMALARDIPFRSYETDYLIAAAAASLNREFPAYGGPRPVTPRNIFRGVCPRERVGPFVSQFLLKGNVDPRKLDGRGRDANEGYISYGAQVIDQRIIPPRQGLDYLTDFDTWLGVQNGEDTRGQDRFGTPGDDPSRRFLYNLRFGATYVHFDQVLNAFYNAAWILMSEPAGNQLEHVLGATGRPSIDPEFAPAGCGSTPLLQVLGEALRRTLRAVWRQKWGVHRRLRPEEFGGRIHNQVQGARRYPIHPSLLASLQSGGLAPFFGKPFARFPESYLLPQAYPEGAPAHPGYGAGHAAGAAACATLLKAFFAESVAIENPVEAAGDGFTLQPYTGADAGKMTVGGEIDKLAGNIALFRQAAGVSFRSDCGESFLLGERVAVRLLQEMSLGFQEDDASFELTRLDGRKIRIFDGKVVPVCQERS